MRRNIAVILAGGIGSRAGAGLPKQLRTLPDGRTVLQTCLDTFRACPMIDEVCVVMHPDYISYVPEGVHCIAGGKERWESSWNAIQALTNDERTVNEGCNILLHDCARPFVSQRILSDVCQALETHDAVTVAVPATDTMYVVNGEGRLENGECRVVDIPDRKTMFRAQTPQAFHLDVIRQAYGKALQGGNMEATDDCGILHRYLPEVPIYIVEGEESNRKLTFKEDFE